jgi:glycosyltransferase involved in cell wall biosynthesis
MEKKVSVVTPCYNGENYLGRFLDCLLKQDYGNIEFVLVNDGSTDRSEDIYISYKDKLKERNIDYKYIKQENRGLAGAVCSGIQIVTGDYLVWPDADDIIMPNFISSRVAVLEKHPNAGVLICPVEIVDESDLSKVLRRTTCDVEWDSNGEANVFSDVIKLQSFLCFPGTFMVRMDMFREANPTMKYPYPKEVGQDFQMLLPICYKYNACYSDVVSFRYVIRSSSHSHSKKTEEESIRKYEIARSLLYQIMDLISFNTLEDRKMAEYNIEYRYNLWMADIGIQYGNKSLFIKYANLIDKRELPKYIKREILFQKYPLVRKLCELASSLKHYKY